jgi:AhpD family alkylhydroperoxidase
VSGSAGPVETRDHVVATPLPPAAELDERLRPFAAVNDDGSVPDDGNELLRFWNAAPEHAAEIMRHHFELWRSSRLGARLAELVRLAVANQTRCPICLAIRRPGARRAGVDEELIRAITDPAHPGMSPREVAAVDYATRLAGDHDTVTAEVYAGLREHFDDAELAELSMLVVSFLAQGRLLETLTRGSTCPVASP